MYYLKTWNFLDVQFLFFFFIFLSWEPTSRFSTVSYMTSTTYQPKKSDTLHTGIILPSLSISLFSRLLFQPLFGCFRQTPRCSFSAHRCCGWVGGGFSGRGTPITASARFAVLAVPRWRPYVRLAKDGATMVFAMLNDDINDTLSSQWKRSTANRPAQRCSLPVDVIHWDLPEEV